MIVITPAKYSTRQDDNSIIDCYLKWLSLPGTALPEAGMVGLFRAPHMFHSDVCHYLVHGRKCLVTRLSGLRLFLVNPQARVFLFDRWSHISENIQKINYTEFFLYLIHYI